MATTKLFNLPPIPPALKSVTPYLQRADELKGKEPIMSYWCAYYAAQVGIGLNIKETSSREFLFELLGLLESMKETIGPNDAIDMEAASAAYVENFAVKVFSMADNEDRRGAATRSTAKKFLAAAHFLEVLKTFPQSELSEPHDEKIRYAKWKAADIAKAFREGRKPTPGPANAEPELDPETLPPPPTLENDVPAPPVPPPPPPPPHLEQEDLPPAPFPPPSLPPPSSDWQNAPSSPGWSTTATPGIPPVHGIPSVGASLNVQGPPPLHSGPLDSTESIIHGDAGDKKEVHFIPSTVVPPPLPPTQLHPSAPPFDPYAAQYTPSLASAPPMVAPEPEPELTEAMIRDAKKHCRYAISSLDYEDRAQALKELRAALKVLGG